MNYVEKHLEKGFHVPVKRDDGYEIISPYKDSWGKYRTSGVRSALEHAKQLIGLSCGYDNLEEQSKEWEILEPFQFEYERFKVGEEVIYNGEKYKIKYNLDTDTDCDYRIENDESENLVYHHELSYPREVEEMTLEEVCKELGRDIKIKK